MSKFKVGDIVTLNSESEYNQPEWTEEEQLPVGCHGKVTEIVDDVQNPYVVEWWHNNNSYTNGYEGYDLVLVDGKEEECLQKITDEDEYTGGSVSYYKVSVENPTTLEEPYQAECNDLIEALGMNYAEGNAFKAIWRRCAARKFGNHKKGYDNGLYDAEKVVFFGERMVVQSKQEISDE